jgi:hypothetical protein
MYAVIRTYSGRGASEVFDLIVQLESEVRDLFKDVPGFVGYTAVRSGEGGSTVSVCQDEAGTDETSRRAAAFLRDKLTGPLDPPVITGGQAILHFAAAGQAAVA